MTSFVIMSKWFTICLLWFAVFLCCYEATIITLSSKFIFICFARHKIQLKSKFAYHYYCKLYFYFEKLLESKSYKHFLICYKQFS